MPLSPPSPRPKISADFPERGLWAAIVADAVDICLGRTFAPWTEEIAARRWIQSPRANVGGFLWCCALLGLDEAAVREQIRRPGRRTAMSRRFGARRIAVRGRQAGASKMRIGAHSH